MPNTDKQKITEEDIQAYLLGEGSANVYAKIQKIDNDSETLLDANDLLIKETLEAFRKVDQLFNEAMDSSIGIPPHLIRQVDAALNSDQAKAKKNIFEQLRGFVQHQFSFGNVFAGGVVGVFTTLAVLNSQTYVTVGMDQNKYEPILRSAGKIGSEKDKSHQFAYDLNWNITKEIAYKFVIFDTADKQRSDTNVYRGETFDLVIIPFNSDPISIKYISSQGEETLLVDNERLVIGKEFFLSVNKFNGERPKFAEPIGTDRLQLISKNAIFETIIIKVN